MTTYKITEKQNLQSERKGDLVKCPTLQAAKIKATKAQMFQGTVLTIEDANGDLLSYKEGGSWTDLV